MEEVDRYNEDLNISKRFRKVGQSIENFVRVNYETAFSVDGIIQPTPEDLPIIKEKIKDIIRNNPLLKSVLKYYRDGRKDYV